MDDFYGRIIKNILKIKQDRNLTQAEMADMIDTSRSQMSKILRKDVYLSIDQMSKFAQGVSMSEIDLITYPVKYVPREQAEDEPLEAVLQIKLKKDKKDQVLNLIFGEHNLEILEK